jgi:hypothetical protein
MDRREALKKLGAGVAIAVVTPAVLPSTRVAHAASGGIGSTGLIGVPEAGQDPVWYPAVGSGSNRKREVGIVFDNSGISCADGSTPEFSVEWRIASIFFDSRGPKPVRLSVGAGSTEYATTPLVSSAYSGGGYGAVSYGTSFTMKKYRRDNKQDILRPFDIALLVARCRWHCPGASEDVVAEYAFAGTAYFAPDVTNLSWDDAASA